MIKISAEFSVVKIFSYPSVSSVNICMPYNFKKSNNNRLTGNNISETQYCLTTFGNQSITFDRKTFSEYGSRVADLQQSTLQKAGLPNASPVVLCVQTSTVHQSPQTLFMKKGLE